MTNDTLTPRVTSAETRLNADDSALSDQNSRLNTYLGGFNSITSIQTTLNANRAELDSHQSRLDLLVPITAKNQGSSVTTRMSSINFVGSGVTTSANSGDVTVTIGTAPPPGTIPSTGPIIAQRNGSTIANNLSSLNLIGDGMDVSSGGVAGQGVIINVPPVVGMYNSNLLIPVVRTLNFSNKGVNVTGSANQLNIDVPAISVKNQGTLIADTLSSINFVGSVFRATSSNNKDVTVNLNALATSDFSSGSVQNFSSNGYQKFPGGFIIQWGNFDFDGVVTNGNGDREDPSNGGIYVTASVNFPLAFPNMALSFVANGINSNNNNEGCEMNIGIRALTPTSATVQISRVVGINDAGAEQGSVNWIAVGY